MATVVLPKESEDSVEVLSEIRDAVTDTNKDNKKNSKKEDKKEQEQLNISKRMEEHLSWFGDAYEKNNSSKFSKMKDKITTGWNKVFKMRWFENVFGFIKNISLSDAAGFLGILLGVFILLKTGLLETLIPIVISMASQLITAIIKYLPTLIKFLGHILFNVLPPILNQIFQLILDQLGIAKDNPIRKLFTIISKILPAFIAGSMIFMKIFPLLKNVFSVLKMVGNVLSKIFTGAAGGAAALVAIFAVIAIYAEEIDAIFEYGINWIADKFKMFAKLGNILKMVVFGLLGPTFILAKLFKNIKREIKEAIGKNGIFKGIFIGLVKGIGAFYKEMLTIIWNALKEVGAIVFKYILTPIGKLFKNLGKTIFGFLKKFSIFRTIVDTVSNAFSKLYRSFSKFLNIFKGKGAKEVLSSLATKLVGIVGSAFEQAKSGFKSAFTGILDVFLAMFDTIDFHLSKLSIFKKSREQQYGTKSAEAYSKEQQLIRKTAEKTGASEDYLQSIAKGEATAKSSDSAEVRKFAQTISKMKSSGEKEQIAQLQAILNELKKDKSSSNVSVTVGKSADGIAK